MNNSIPQSIMTRDYVELEGGWFWWSTWSWSYMIIMVLILIIIKAKQFHHLGFPIMMTMIITMITMIIKGVKYKRWPPWRPAALWFSTTAPLFILTPPLCGISLTGLMMMIIIIIIMVLMMIMVLMKRQPQVRHHCLWHFSKVDRSPG